MTSFSRFRVRTAVLSVAALACLVGPAWAGEPVGADVRPTAFTEPVVDDRLDSLRGGDGVDNDSRVRGELSGNSADRVSTGDNTLGGGAFANAGGITTVIQNTGANVLIQNGMVVNVQFVDPTP
jgi:hypothetical protein